MDSKLNSTKQKEMRFAYKCILNENYVIFLFEKVNPFKEDEQIELKLIDNELFVLFGDNVVLLTEKIINVLKKKPIVVFAESPFYVYEGEITSYTFEVDLQVLAKIEGALAVIKSLNQQKTIGDLAVEKI